MNAVLRLVKTVQLVLTDTMTTCVFAKKVTLEKTVGQVSISMAFCMEGFLLKVT